MKRQLGDSHRPYRDLKRVLAAARAALAPIRAAGAGIRRVRATSLHGLVDDCAETVRRLVGPEVTLDLRAERDSVAGDPAELEQVLLDVCLCACDCLVQGGTLTLSTDNVIQVHTAEPAGPPDLTWVRLVVSDSGPGRDDLGERCGPEVDALPLARAIVSRYGGTLAVRSAPRWGTTVSVCLPCAASGSR